nr:hypothetical protein [Tanacetum cinerariifolium]
MVSLGKLFGTIPMVVRCTEEAVERGVDLVGKLGKHCLAGKGQGHMGRSGRRFLEQFPWVAGAQEGKMGVG